jgi:hypothetical protein
VKNINTSIFKNDFCLGVRSNVWTVTTFQSCIRIHVYTHTDLLLPSSPELLLYVCVRLNYYGISRFKKMMVCVLGVGVAQSVLVSMDWTTGRSRFDPRQMQEDFSSNLCVWTGSGAHPASCPMGTRSPFPGGKAWLGYDTGHSTPSSAGHEWVGAIPPLPPCPSP